MKAHIVYDPVCDRHLVYFYDRAEDGSRWTTHEGRRVEVPAGAELPVRLTVTSQEYEALVAEIYPPAEAASTDAVRDARETRDRLLSLVEHTVTRPRR